MKQFIAFVVKESRHILRDKRTMLILFGMPVVMMLLFGFAISTDVRNVRTVVVSTEVNADTQRAIEQLRASTYFNVTQVVGLPSAAERCLRQQEADVALVFPNGYVRGRDALQVLTDGTDPNMAQQWVAYLSRCLASGDTSEMEANAGINLLMLYNPGMKSAYNFVPGIMGLILMLVCAMMTSISIVREKERGSLEVLLVSPVRSIVIIVAKAVPYLFLAVADLIIILLLSRYVLGVPIAGSVGLIALVSVIYILMALSLGLLISTVARTQFVALLLSAMVLLLPSLLLSGMMFPIESMPTVLQWVSAIMPPRYYISAIRRLMIMGAEGHQVLREMVTLSAMLGLFLFIALVKFKSRLE